MIIARPVAGVTAPSARCAAATRRTRNASDQLDQLRFPAAAFVLQTADQITDASIAVARNRQMRLGELRFSPEDIQALTSRGSGFAHFGSGRMSRCRPDRQMA